LTAILIKSWNLHK